MAVALNFITELIGSALIADEAKQFSVFLSW